MALELHIVCYPGKSLNRVRLEETPNPRLESECIITDANTRVIIFLLLQHVFLMLRLKIEHNCRIRGVFYPFKKKSGNKFFLLCKSP